MVRLSVNVNKIATLRNARGKGLPDVLSESQKLIQAGAQGITVHPRPDGRHILWSDIESLKENIKVELNIEGYPSRSFLEKILEVEPAQCTLVPDPPEVLTSNEGWKVFEFKDLLIRSVYLLKSKPIRVSVFVNPETLGMEDLLLLRDMGVDCIELYTESYADSYRRGEGIRSVESYKKWAKLAHSTGFAVNAGHDLNLENLKFFCHQIPEIEEVSIGHALICDALNWGWNETVKRYLSCLNTGVS